MQLGLVVMDRAGNDEFIGTGALHGGLQAGADAGRRAGNRFGQHPLDAGFFLGIPAPFHAVYRSRQRPALATLHAEKSQLQRGQEPGRLGVAVGDDQVQGHHRIRLRVPAARPVAAAVDLQRLHQQVGREMRGKGEGQAEVSRQLGAVEARPEQPDRHLGALARNRSHHLTRPCRRQIALQLDHVFREAVFGRIVEMAAQRPHRRPVGARRTAQAEVDAVREQGGQGAELFGNRQRCMVRQHDAA